MEGQGDNTDPKVVLEGNAASSSDQNTNGDNTSEPSGEETSSKPEDEPQNKVTVETVTSEEAQDDKEGSTDSQSEPFEMVKIPDSENNSDDGQGETTQNGKSGDPSVDPNTVKENDVEDENKADKDSYVDILGNGLLKKKVLKQGGGRSTRPNHGDVVTLSVEGRLDDNSVVDKQTDTKFVLGDGDVIQAWDLGVSLMELGEQCELITDSRYAYGEIGREPDIPSNARITYTLELTLTEETPKLSELTVLDRLAKGETKRERGNFLFARRDFTGAINSYSKALTVLQYPGSNAGAEEGTLESILDCQLKCSNNLAACQLKIEAYDAAIRSCESVLQTQPTNVKALYRIGKAYGSKGENDEALKYLRKAIKIDPTSKILHAEMSALTSKVKKETDSERAMYRRMMGTNESSKKQTGKSWWKVPLVFGGVLAGIASVGLAVAYRYGQH